MAKYEALRKHIKEISIRNRKLVTTGEVYSVTNSQGFVKSTEYFDKEVFSKDISNYKVVSRNQFAYNPSRINVGSIDYLEEVEHVVISPLYVVFECADSLFPNYLKLFLKSRDGILKIKSKTKGAVRDILSFKSLSEICVPLPPLSEQIQIAEILTQAETLIAQRKESIRLLDELVKSKFLEMFGDPVKNEIVELSKVATVTSGLTKGKKYEGKETEFVPYMRVANVQDGYLDLSEIKEIEATSEEILRYDLKKGDLLLTEGGDPDKLGRGTVWNNEIERCIFQNHIFRVRIIENRLNSNYLSFLTGSSYGKQYFLKSAKQTTGIASINSTQLKDFPVILPKMQFQEQFARIVEQVERQKKIYNQGLAELQNLFTSLSQKAFRGELTFANETYSLNEFKSLDSDVAKETKSQRKKRTAEKSKKSKVIELKPTNVDFYRRTILAAEIVWQLHKEPTFGHLKLQKLLFLCIRTSNMQLPANFTRQAMGPYDPQLMRSIDKQLQEKKWFLYDKDKSLKYEPLGNAGQHQTDFQKYYSSEQENIFSLIKKFRTTKSDTVEIVATLYACLENMIEQKETFSESLLLKKFYDWSDRKKGFDELEVRRVFQRMKDYGILPKGI
ncbi:restriction endonuclease subunit S [Leptospira kirschneri]|uniref:restriction endonuclease subunit S n=1 Tax=Leptospira kirschneri TaxID=29507 RepID=UPI003569DF42